MEAVNKISKFLFTWVITFLIWLAFTSTFELVEVIVGVVVSFVISIYNYNYFTQIGLKSFSPRRLMYIVQYIFVFLWALLLSNINVARIVLTPSLPISPAIVEFDSKLNSDFAKLILANSITLTPGTFTIDFIDNRFFIHRLESKSVEPEKVYAEVAEPFEKILLKIFN
ncbi:MAG: Na+/H+ antiporter subunit E [Bacteroidota bacterium]|nr:Na+/H+ antiporter subunit E [Bacteroidota bacterium]